MGREIKKYIILYHYLIVLQQCIILTIFNALAGICILVVKPAELVRFKMAVTACSGVALQYAVPDLLTMVLFVPHVTTALVTEGVQIS